MFFLRFQAEEKFYSFLKYVNKFHILGAWNSNFVILSIIIKKLNLILLSIVIYKPLN